MTIKSTNPDDPIVDPNYLRHPNDIANLVEALRVNMRVMLTEAFRDLKTKQFEPIVDNCRHHGLWTDDYLECVARTEAGT